MFSGKSFGGSHECTLGRGDLNFFSVPNGLADFVERALSG